MKQQNMKTIPPGYKEADGPTDLVASPTGKVYSCDKYRGRFNLTHWRSDDLVAMVEESFLTDNGFTFVNFVGLPYQLQPGEEVCAFKDSDHVATVWEGEPHVMWHYAFESDKGLMDLLRWMDGKPGSTFTWLRKNGSAPMELIERESTPVINNLPEGMEMIKVEEWEPDEPNPFKRKGATHYITVREDAAFEPCELAEQGFMEPMAEIGRLDINGYEGYLMIDAMDAIRMVTLTSVPRSSPVATPEWPKSVTNVKVRSYLKNDGEPYKDWDERTAHCVHSFMSGFDVVRSVYPDLDRITLTEEMIDGRLAWHGHIEGVCHNCFFTLEQLSAESNPLAVQE